MNIKDIKDEFGHLFNIVSEPTHSKEKLFELQKKYPAYTTQEIYWLYQIQGFQNEMISIIPDIDDWCYYYERFLRYNGNPSELKYNSDFEDVQTLDKTNNCHLVEGEDIISSLFLFLFVFSSILVFMGYVKTLRLADNFRYFQSMFRMK